MMSLVEAIMIVAKASVAVGCSVSHVDLDVMVSRVNGVVYKAPGRYEPSAPPSG